jgi:type IV pilus assembly protein PilV
MLTLGARRVRRPIHATGFTLIEILIALLVLSIGLLGLAAVQVQSLQNSYASYERSMATMQARDLVERLWAGICDLYDEDGIIVSGAEGAINAGDTILGSWAEDHIEIGIFAGQEEPILAVNTDTDVWTITIDWIGRQEREEQIRHLFRLPPPPKYNEVCL